MAKKKINYAELFTLRKDGRYQGSYTDDTGRHIVCDRDPEKLWHKINDQKEEKPVLFREIAEAWQDTAWETIRDGTKSCYEAPLQRAIDRMGDFPANEITTRDIITHMNILKAQGYSRSTIKIQRTVYSQIFQAAMIHRKYEKIILYNPAQNAKLPTGLPAPKKREAPEDEIVKAIQDNAQTAYFGIFAMFLICTGFRRGEALAVKWGDINFREETISCTGQVTSHSGISKEAPTKTENGVRTVPLLPPLKNVLIKPKGAKATDYVFFGEDPSKPMPGATYDRRWLHYCKDMGFVEDIVESRVSVQGKSYEKHNYKPTLTAHALRHGYATILFEAEVDMYTAQRLLGHADIATTMAVYTHLREKKMSSSIDKLKAHTVLGV